MERKTTNTKDIFVGDVVPDLKAQRELMWQKLRQMIADGHASGIAEWTDADDMLAKFRQRAAK